MSALFYTHDQRKITSQNRLLPKTNRRLLNNINFYPVPDADTGTNLASTMHSIVSTVQPQENVKETALALADAALMGARGNSGVILSQIFRGFSKSLSGKNEIKVADFADALQAAADNFAAAVE